MSAKRYWALLIAVLSVTAFLAVAGGDTGRRTTSAVPAKPPDKTAPLGKVAASQLLTNSEALGTLPGASSFAAIGSKPMAPDEVSPALSNTDGSISAKAEIEFLIHLIVAAKEAGEVPNPAWYDRLTELSPPPTPSGRSLDQGNDACPPTVITACPYTDTGTTVGYVNNYTTCIGNSAPDVIYQYTPTTTGVHVVSLCGSGYDTALEIRTGGTCPGTTQVGCNDDFCGLQSQLSVSLTAGTTYYIIVDGYASNSGSYVLNLTCPSACTPDATINAPGSYSASTCGAGDDCALRAGADRIVRVNIPVSGQWTFSLCHPTINWDTYMYLTTACCGGTTLATDDDACPEFGVGLSLINCFQLAAGTYYVDIEPYSSALCSTFTLSVSQCTPCDVACVPTDVLECTENPADTTFYRTDCNGGCNSEPDLFQTLGCGQTVCGDVFTYVGPGGANFRDTDWYLFTMTNTSNVSWTVVAEVAVNLFIIDITNCNNVVILASGSAPTPCTPSTITANALGPGTYAAWVGTQVFSGIPPSDYRGTLIWECPVTAGPFLRIGDWMNPEPWHNWIGGPYDITRVQLHMLDPLNSIQFVEFLFSMDGETWQPFYTDADGYEPTEDTYNPAIISDGDGWSGYFPHEMIPQQNMILHFRAVAYGSTGTVVVENRTNYDPTPPSSVVTNVPDWMPTPHDFIAVDIDPELANIDCVVVWCEEKADTFSKGIPGISQQPHSPTHCAPTAMAACLKYFEAQGDTDICGGLNDHDLVDSLAGRCGTNQGRSGTNPSDLANGTRGWINDHGGGYTVRGPLDFNWQEMRDELERCQDVLSGIRWTGSGSHRMTFNSIVNRPDPNTGRIRVDFMDPWTGQTEWGNMNPATGQVSGFTGAGASGTLGNTIIVCPAESDPGGGGGGGGGGPGPNPGPIPIPLPHPGLWFLHMIVIDLDAHAHRLIRVVERLLPPILDLVIHSSGNDLILNWSAVPYATSYRIYTSPVSTGGWTYLATTTINSYTHVDGAASPRLFYHVTAVRP